MRDLTGAGLRHAKWPIMSGLVVVRLAMCGFAFGGYACGLGISSAVAAPASFGEEGAGAGQISGEPIGIAVSQQSGDVFVADSNNQRAARFSDEGSFRLAWGWGVVDGEAATAQVCTLVCFAGLGGAGAGQFGEHSAEGVAVDNDPVSPSFTDVYVVDEQQHRVEKFLANGTFVLMFGGEVNETKDETPGATEAERNICTAASGDTCTSGTTGTGLGQFEAGSGSVAIDNEGTIYVGDVERVQKFNMNGSYVGQLTLVGAGDVTAVAVDTTKALYVKSTEVAGVRKFSAAGSELGEARDLLGEARTLTVGPASELFVDDGQNSAGHHILKYDPAGDQFTSFDAQGEGGSRGIAYGETLSVLYVLNAGTVRLVNPPPAGPLVLSESSEAIEPTSATLGAVVNPEGPATTHTNFEYGTSTAYGESTASEELKGGAFEDQPASAAITGLQPRTLYHFRVVVSNGLGESTDGPDQTFMTSPPVMIDGESATQLGSTSVRLSAELNPLGEASEYHFDFGLSASYEHSEPAPDASLGSGRRDVAVELLLQGLAPGTTYHYRVVAHNALGIVDGEDRTFTTQRAAAAVLPDGREWEMVSPTNKEGVSLEGITEEGGVIQAAESGGAITYVAKAAIEAGSPSNRSIEDTQVLSRRSAGVWSSRDISTPYESVATIRAGFPSEYTLFSGDLSTGLVAPEGATPLSPLTTERTPYRREVDGEYIPLVTASNVASGVEFGGIEESGGKFNGGVTYASANTDASHVILASPDNLTTGFEGAGRTSLFEWANGALKPVSILPHGESAGAAGLDSSVGTFNENFMRDAVSKTGNRVIFNATEGSFPHLYLRDMALEETIQLDAPQGGTGGSDEEEYQGANSDASKVFFTDSARLTSDSKAGPGRPDLYMCEVSQAVSGLLCDLKDLTVDVNPGEVADVQGALVALDESGRYVYFAANGVLAPGAAPADCGEESSAATCNLYLRDTVSGQTRLVAVLSGDDDPDWIGNRVGLGKLTARTSPDGHYLTFMSERSLTGYDNRDARSGQPDEEVFLYDEEGGVLTCVSCNRSGARPEGILDPESFPGLLVDRPHTWPDRWLAGSIPGWTLFDFKQALYQSRYLSNSGRMFFNSSDALVPQDANGKEDVYEYEPEVVGGCTQVQGCVSLISSGSSSEESAFLDASASGSDVFFLTAAKLSTADVDSDFDVYDAHVCTTEAPCPPSASSVPPPCTTTDSCRAAPSPQPQIFGAPPSATFSGSGNLLAAKPVVKAPTRAQLLAKALSACAKKAKRKRPVCRADAQRHYGAKKSAKKAKKKGARKSSRHSTASRAKGRGQ
jgi:hypothetical protein